MVIPYLGIPVGFVLGEWYLKNRENPIVRTVFFPFEIAYQAGIETRKRIESAIAKTSQQISKSLEIATEPIKDVSEKVQDTISKVKDTATKVQDVINQTTDTFEKITSQTTTLATKTIKETVAQPVERIVEVASSGAGVAKPQIDSKLIVTLGIGLGIIALLVILK